MISHLTNTTKRSLLYRVHSAQRNRAHFAPLRSVQVYQSRQIYHSSKLESILILNSLRWSSHRTFQHPNSCSMIAKRSLQYVPKLVSAKRGFRSATGSEKSINQISHFLQDQQKKIERMETGTGRFYKVGSVDQKLPSVTTVLDIVHKPELEVWKRNTSFNALKEAYHERQAEVLLDERILEMAKEKKGFIAYLKEQRYWLQGAIARASRSHLEITNNAASFGLDAHSLIDSMLLAHLNQQKMPPVPSELSSVANSFSSFLKNSDLTFFAGDTLLFHPTLHYAGAADAIAWLPDKKPSSQDVSNTHSESSPATAKRKSKKTPEAQLLHNSESGSELQESPNEPGVSSLQQSGGIVIIDWKTTKGTRWSHAVQVAAYAAALEAMLGSEGFQLVKHAWVVRFANSSCDIKKVRNLPQAFESFKACLHLYKSVKEDMWE